MMNPAFIIKTIFSIGILVLIAVKSDITRYMDYVYNMDLRYTFIAVCLNFSLLAVNGYKIRVILESQPVTLLNLFRYNNIKVFFTQLLPGAVSGEIIRILYLGERLGSHLHAIAAVLMDRLTGLWVQFAIALVAVIITVKATSERIYIFLAGFIFLGLIIFFGKIFYNLFFRLSTKSLAVLGSSIPNQREFTKTFNTLIRNRTKLLEILGVSFLYQMFLGAILVLLDRSLGNQLSLSQALIILFLNVLVTTFPISIAGWGVTEALYAWMFVWFGQPMELGVALSLIFRISMLPPCLLGWYYFLEEGIPFRDMLKSISGLKKNN